MRFAAIVLALVAISGSISLIEGRKCWPVTEPSQTDNSSGGRSSEGKSSEGNGKGCPRLTKAIINILTGIVELLRSILNSTSKDFEDLQKWAETASVTKEDVLSQADKILENAKSETQKQLEDYAVELARYVGVNDVNPADIISGAGIPENLWSCIRDKINKILEQKAQKDAELDAEYQRFVDHWNSSKPKESKEDSAGKPSKEDSAGKASKESGEGKSKEAKPASHERIPSGENFGGI